MVQKWRRSWHGLAHGVLLKRVPVQLVDDGRRVEQTAGEATRPGHPRPLAGWVRSGGSARRRLRNLPTNIALVALNRRQAKVPRWLARRDIPFAISAGEARLKTAASVGQAFEPDVRPCQARKPDLHNEKGPMASYSCSACGQSATFLEADAAGARLCSRCGAALALTEAVAPRGTIDYTPVTSPSLAESPAGLPKVPGYEIVGELGRGGMGVVYRAWQVAIKRAVALKMIRGSQHLEPDELLRFRNEAEAVGRLQHPNIVQIYEVGEQDGRPYFSLEPSTAAAWRRNWRASRCRRAKQRNCWR
jgi:Protein kinase domain